MTTPPPSDGKAHPLDFIAPQADIWGQRVEISGQETEDAAKRIVAAANLGPKPQPPVKIRKRRDPTAYINDLWFRLLPWSWQQKIMARRYWKRMSKPRSNLRPVCYTSVHDHATAVERHGSAE